MAHGEASRAKRLLDLLSLAMLAPLLLPVGLVIALAVFLDSAGPVIFRAERVGAHGDRFEMLKFRTMRVGVPGAAIAGSDDARITPVGRFLRRSRLDELPQLWNVLRGEMSMVGPRPEVEEFVGLHPDEYRRILAVPPGITGPTQLRFAGVEARLLSLHHDPEAYYRDELLPDKVAMDLDYARDHSLGGDIKVLLQTLALPLILALQGPAEGGTNSRPRRSVYVAGAVMAVAVVPLLFAVGLGSPR